jgi:hypothetical protein
VNRFASAGLFAVGLTLVGACGSGPSGDETISTFNPNPDVTASIPTEEEMQAELERSEEFAATVIGLTEQEAIDAIEAEGLIARVVARDGEFYAVTEDYSVSRINLVVEAGLVTEATVG